MKISPAGNNLIKSNLIKHPQLKFRNEVKFGEYKNKIDECKKKKNKFNSDCKKIINEYENKLNDNHFRRLMVFIFFSLAFSISSYESVSKKLTDLTKTQKACEIAKWATKVSLGSGLLVFADILCCCDLLKIVKKQTKAAPVQNNINNLNYKSDVFADFDILTATTINK